MAKPPLPKTSSTWPAEGHFIGQDLEHKQDAVLNASRSLLIAKRMKLAVNEVNSGLGDIVQEFSYSATIVGTQ